MNVDVFFLPNLKEYLEFLFNPCNQSLQVSPLKLKKEVIVDQAYHSLERFHVCQVILQITHILLDLDVFLGFEESFVSHPCLNFFTVVLDPSHDAFKVSQILLELLIIMKLIIMNAFVLKFLKALVKESVHLEELKVSHMSGLQELGVVVVDLVDKDRVKVVDTSKREAFVEEAN